jgi:glycosyltransferase involved in cell wall biosynthesis
MISIISPIFNRERFIKRFLRSIQNQIYHNFEIIFVDDCSRDNIIKLIEDMQKEDERIILIKNKKNKGTFKARNIGVLYAIGKYIIMPDPDDILYKGILKYCYNLAERYNYEIINFSLYLGNGLIRFEKFRYKHCNKLINQPELSTYIYYGNNVLEIIDFNIYNKFIRREVYIKSLNKLNNFYLDMYMIYMEDLIMNYFLFRTAKTMFLSKKVGYYYLRNSISITNNLIKISKMRIKYIFIYFKIIFEFTKNTKYEKDMANLLFTILNKAFNILKNSYYANRKDFNFYNEIIKLYLNCKLITNDNKYLLKKFFTLIKKNK